MLTALPLMESWCLEARTHGPPPRHKFPHQTTSRQFDERSRSKNECSLPEILHSKNFLMMTSFKDMLIIF